MRKPVRHAASVAAVCIGLPSATTITMPMPQLKHAEHLVVGDVALALSHEKTGGRVHDYA